MRSLIATVVFNALIAGFLAGLGFGGGFAVNLVFSQCIGLSIMLLCLGVLRLPLDGLARGAAIVVAIAVGALGGHTLARLLTGLGASADGSHEFQSLLVGLVFGGIAAAFFWLRERNAKLEAELRTRELARLEAEKQSLAAQLRLLQAQIEPHFLFNSLANVAALIEAEPTLAGRLLDALIRYLRASLQRTRAERGTLGDEVALLTAYLDVLRIRMGDRLELCLRYSARAFAWRRFSAHVAATAGRKRDPPRPRTQACRRPTARRGGDRGRGAAPARQR
jgi:hypothetical protein